MSEAVLSAPEKVELPPQLPEILGPEFSGHWVENLNEEIYHADKTSVSSGGVRAALRSPRNFFRRYIVGVERDETDAMRFGSAAHLAILEPERFKQLYVVQPDFGPLQSSTNRAKRDMWKLSLPAGSVVLTQGELDRLRWMIDSLMEHPVAVNLLKGAATEVSGYFRDPVTGLKCRFRPDVVRMDFGALPDLKTTKDCTADSFAKDIWNRGYYIQLAFYAFGVEQITGRRPSDPCFIAVENQEPFETEVYGCDEAMLERGEVAVRNGLDRIAASIRSGKWEMASKGMARTISLPAWTDWKGD